MPNTGYKNIFPHWDPQNKRQIVKQNRNNKFIWDSFFITHTIFVLYSAYLPGIQTFTFFEDFFKCPKYQHIFMVLIPFQNLTAESIYMWRTHISVTSSSAPHHRPPQDLDLNFAGLGDSLNKFLLHFPVEKLSIVFSASGLSLLLNTHKKYMIIPLERIWSI